MLKPKYVFSVHKVVQYVLHLLFALLVSKVISCLMTDCAIPHVLCDFMQTLLLEPAKAAPLTVITAIAKAIVCCVVVLSILG